MVLWQYRNAAWHAAQFDTLTARTANGGGAVAAGARPLQTGSASAVKGSSGKATNQTLTTEDAVAYFQSNAFLPRMGHRDLNLLWQRNVGKTQNGNHGVTRSQFLAMVNGILAGAGKPARPRAQTAAVMTASQRGMAGVAAEQSAILVADPPLSSPFPPNDFPAPTQGRRCTTPWMHNQAADAVVFGDTGRPRATTADHAVHL